MSVSANSVVSSIYDSKAKFYSTPFFSKNDEVAIRDFVDVIQHTDNPMSKNRDDYSLVSIGVFNADTGVMLAHEPETIFSGSSLD